MQTLLSLDGPYVLWTVMKLSIENVVKYVVYGIKTLESSILSACFCVQELHEYLSSWIVLRVHQDRL